MIPASMGLRFQIPAELERFTVTASWGTYERVKTGEVDKKGRAISVYRRTPVEITEPIAVDELTPGRTVTKLLTGRVVSADRPLRGCPVRAAAGRDRAVQRPGDPAEIPVDAWLFQTRLRVEAGGAGGVPAGAGRARP